jgi:flagellar export protein FliJ
VKKFHFPLDRALDWRRTQARIEESKLERLYTALRTIDAQDVALHNERTQTETALLSAGEVTGQELAALGAFQRHVRAEQARLKQARQECGKKIAAQIEAVTGKRRDVKLIENVKRRRLDGWTAELGREIDRDADEAFLAKWNRG